MSEKRMKADKSSLERVLKTLAGLEVMGTLVSLDNPGSSLTIYKPEPLDTFIERAAEWDLDDVTDLERNHGAFVIGTFEEYR